MFTLEDVSKFICSQNLTANPAIIVSILNNNNVAHKLNSVETAEKNDSQEMMKKTQTEGKFCQNTDITIEELRAIAWRLSSRVDSFGK